MWNSQGGDFDAGTASSQVSIPAFETEKWTSFDVSSIVSRWVTGQAPNLGFLVKSDNEAQANYNFTVLASNDYSPAASVRPQLQVTYTDGTHATPPTVAVSAPALGATVSGSTVTLSAAASSAGAVSKVQFFVDGSSVGTAGDGAEGPRTGAGSGSRSVGWRMGLGVRRTLRIRTAPPLQQARSLAWAARTGVRPRKRQERHFCVRGSGLGTVSIKLAASPHLIADSE